MKGKLCLSSYDKKIAGVCGGVAHYFNLDPSIVRLIWVLLAFVLRGFPIIIYILCWAIIPNDY